MHSLEDNNISSFLNLSESGTLNDVLKVIYVPMMFPIYKYAVVHTLSLCSIQLVPGGGIIRL